MEKTLVKTAIYTFITSFLLLTVLIPRSIIITDANGLSSDSAKTYPEFFFMILEYSITITFIIVINVFLIKLFNYYEKLLLSLAIGIIIGLIIVLSGSPIRDSIITSVLIFICFLIPSSIIHYLRKKRSQDLDDN